jgi:hypothetical protein
MDENTLAKNITMLAAYLQLVYLQTEVVLCDKSKINKQNKLLIKYIGNYAKQNIGTLCNLGNMDKDALIDLAGEIDDILRPNIIQENTVKNE